MKLARDLWYPVLESREVKRRPVASRRLGVDLVFWRDESGRAVAQEDRCPHLGAALHGGAVASNCIVCPFHGLRFDAGGRCVEVPSLGRAATVPEALRVRTYPTREKAGLIWLWWGDGPPGDDIPFFEELESGWTWFTTTVEWPVHYTRAVENQLDVAHVSIVHRTTIGRGGRTRVEGPRVESDARGIRVWVTNRVDDGGPPRAAEALSIRGGPPQLQLLFPGAWQLHISSGFRNFIAFVPIDEGRTLYYLRSYLPSRWGVLGWLMHRVTRWTNRVVLGQDRRVVVTQTPPMSFDARDDRLLPTDRAIIEYRKWLDRTLER